MLLGLIWRGLVRLFPILEDSRASASDEQNDKPESNYEEFAAEQIAEETADRAEEKIERIGRVEEIEVEIEVGEVDDNE